MSIALLTIGSLVAALFLGAYIPFVFVPVTTEAFRLTALRRKSFSLTTAIDRGEIQVNSAIYWMAIEQMTDADQFLIKTPGSR